MYTISAIALVQQFMFLFFFLYQLTTVVPDSQARRRAAIRRYTDKSLMSIIAFCCSSVSDVYKLRQCEHCPERSDHTVVCHNIRSSANLCDRICQNVAG